MMTNYMKIQKNEKIKETIIQHWAYLFLFAAFFTLLRVSPMMYDGWFGSDYYNNEGGLINWIIYMWPFYLWINGRIFSTFFSGILESFPSEILYDFTNSLVMVLIFWALCKIFNIKNNKEKNFAMILYYSLILFMPTDMRTYVVQIANTSFIPPILFCLIFFIAGRYYLNNVHNSSKKLLWLMLVTAAMISTWLESIALGFGITLSLTSLAISIKKKERIYYLWLSTIVAFISGSIMMLSPGFKNSRTVYDGNIGLVNTFFNNVKLLYQFLIHQNEVAILTILIIIIVILLQKKGWSSLYSKIINIIYFILLTVIFLDLVNSNLFHNLFIQDVIDNIYYGIINSRPISLFVIFILIVLFGYVISITDKKVPLILLLMLMIFSLLPICFTPNLSSRVSSVGFFMILSLCVGLFSEIDLEENNSNHLLLFGIIVFGILAVDKQILLCRRISLIYNQQQTIITEARLEQKFGDWDYEGDILKLPYYYEGDVYKQGIVFPGTFHYPFFLSKNDLADQTNVIFSNSDYYLIRVEQDGNDIDFNIVSYININEGEKFYYIFRDLHGQEIFSSGEAVNENWTVTCPIGEYEVNAYLCIVDKDGTIDAMTLIDQPIFISCQ